MQTEPNLTLPFSSSLGGFLLERSSRGLTRCQILPAEAASIAPSSSAAQEDPLLQQAMAELQAYLTGSLKRFTVPLDLSGLSPFQQKVLTQVQLIPWGKLQTYAQVAAQIGQPQAQRAVGGALAHNPLLLFIPCHRVVSSGGQLGGFSAPQGIALKAWLLTHEGRSIINNRRVVYFKSED